jgi:hypothetical protein
MAFLRFNRDKRGYEHFYLVEATTNRRGKTRARVLYWFRTPPNVKVGREPFDPDLRRALEAQNPGVSFDWKKIAETPIPSADAERWRERRRLERAERTARRGAAEPEENGDMTVDAAEQQADSLEPTEESLVLSAASMEPAVPALDAEAAANRHPIVGQAGGAIGNSTDRALRRHRRRRHGRRDAPREPTASRASAAPIAPGASGEPGELREPAEPGEPREPAVPRASAEPREPPEHHEPGE